MDQILPNEDKDVVKELARSYKKLGVNILTSTAVKSIEDTGKGVKVTVKDRKKGETTILEADKAMVAIGFKPRTTGYGLENTGVKLTERGAIDINSKMQTNIPNLYAIGDVTAKLMLAHVAETLLDRLRSGRCTMSSGVSAVLLESVDVLRHLLTGAREHTPTDASLVSALKQRLERAIVVSAAPPPPAAVVAATAPQGHLLRGAKQASFAVRSVLGLGNHRAHLGLDGTQPPFKAAAHPTNRHKVDGERQAERCPGAQEVSFALGHRRVDTGITLISGVILVK